MNENVIMNEDIVALRDKAGREKMYGAVAQHYNDEHSPLEEGTVLVDWYDNDDSDDAEVDEALLTLKDRSLMPRDIVQDNGDTNKIGTVVDVRKDGDFCIVGTDKKLKNIECEKLVCNHKFLSGEIVAYGNSIGKILNVQRIVYVKTADGQKGCIGENLLQLMEQAQSVTNVYPHYTDKSRYENVPAGCSRYYPGQYLECVPECSQVICWNSHFNPNSKNFKLIILKVAETSVEVRWNTATVCQDNEDAKTYLKNLNIPDSTKTPNSVISEKYLPWLKTFDSFKYCEYALGQRFSYTLTEEDASELNNRVKKRKKKHMQTTSSRKSQRLETRHHPRRRGASSSNYRQRVNRTLNRTIGGEDSSSSDEYEDIKEESFLETTDKVEDKRGEKKPEKSADDGEKLMKVAVRNLAGGKSKLPEQSPVYNLTDEICKKVFSKYSSKSKSILKTELKTHEIGGLKMCVFKLGSKRTVCIIEKTADYKKVGDVVFTDDAVKCLQESDVNFEDEDKNTIETALKNSNNKVVFAFFGKLKFKTDYLEETDSAAVYYYGSGLENAELKNEDVFAQGTKQPFQKGQKVTIEMSMPRTQVVVEWQDRTRSDFIPSTSVIPQTILNDHDFFPGEFVKDEREGKKGDIFKYGCIIKILTQKRMALVQWFTIVNGLKLVTLESEEVSVYELSSSSDEKFRIYDILFVYGALMETTSNIKPNHFNGQMLGVTEQGKLIVRWSSDNTVSEVYPQEVQLHQDGEFGFDDYDYEMDNEEFIFPTEFNSDDEIKDEDDNDSWEDLPSSATSEEDYEGDGQSDAPEVETEQEFKSSSSSSDNDNYLLNENITEEAFPENVEKKAEGIDEKGDGVKKEDLQQIKNLTMSQFDVLEKAPTSHKFYSKQPQRMLKPFLNSRKRDLKLFAKSCPVGVFVRAYEDRMDLMSAMIAGPDNTPFRDSLFVFEIYFPPTYPEKPPKVHYVSMSQRINPNLYEDGTVCVSLLGTWSGDGNENWTKDSSILQVLLSIQGLILVKEPYFNEAGYESQRGVSSGINRSRWYNEMVVMRMVNHMTNLVNNPCPPFNSSDNHYKSLLKQYVPSFIQRYKLLIETSEQHLKDNKSDQDLSDISGFPLLCLSEGVITGLSAKVERLKQVAEEKGLM